jgi:hypothetical protein
MSTLGLIMDQKLHVPESLTKRAEELKLHHEARKKDAEDEGGASWFKKKLTESLVGVNEELKLLELTGSNIPKDEIGERLNHIDCTISTLHKSLSSFTPLLIPYEVKRSKNALSEAKEKLSDIENKLLPKKKFGFKSKGNVKCVIKGEKKPVTLTSNGTKHDEPVIVRENETIHMSREDVAGKEVQLANLSGCTVIIEGSPKALNLTSLRDCVIASGPVTTSVLLYNMTNCVLGVACQQLRVHNASHSRFFVHVTAPIVIEDSKNVKFGPYNFYYPGFEEDFKSSGLKEELNSWNCINDFNWLVSGKPSPNWSIMPDDERSYTWPI